jgi:hypothetical protein
MVYWLQVEFDLVKIFVSLGLAYYCYRLLRFFKGGIFESPFEVLTLSGVVFAVAELAHILTVLLDGNGFLLSVHFVMEVFFIMLLLYSFRLFYKSWTRISRK